MNFESKIALLKLAQGQYYQMQQPQQQEYYYPQQDVRPDAPGMSSLILPALALAGTAYGGYKMAPWIAKKLAPVAQKNLRTLYNAKNERAVANPVVKKVVDAGKGPEEKLMRTRKVLSEGQIDQKAKDVYTRSELGSALARAKKDTPEYEKALLNYKNEVNRRAGRKPLTPGQLKRKTNPDPSDFIGE